MDIEHFRNQAHAQWMEEYKRYACQILVEGWGTGVQEAIIIAPFIHPIEEEMMDPAKIEDAPPTFHCKAKITMPEGSIQTILCMSRYTHVLLDFPISVNGYDISRLPVYSFALSSLLESSFPRNVRSNKFKNTTGGMLAGLDVSPNNGTLALHKLFSGVGILLMEKCRQTLSPFGTDKDLIELTSEMFLVFLATEVNMEGRFRQ